MKAQSLDLSQMNWQVAMQDVSLLVETGKLEKLVDELVAQRGTEAKMTSTRRPSSSSRRSP